MCPIRAGIIFRMAVCNRKETDSNEWRLLSTCSTRKGLYIHHLIYTSVIFILGFPSGSNGKESACIAGDLGWIPGLGRSPGGGRGSPFQYSCLEKPMDIGAWWATVYRVTESDTTEGLSTAQQYLFWASQAALVVKNLSASAGDFKRCRFDPWVGKIPWRRKW